MYQILRLSQYVINMIMNIIESAVIDDSLRGSLFVDLLVDRYFIRLRSHSWDASSGLSIQQTGPWYLLQCGHGGEFDCRF